MTRISMSLVLFLVGSIALPLTAPFQSRSTSCQCQPSQPICDANTWTLAAVKSKGNRNSVDSKSKKGGWDGFKKALYTSVDGASDLASKLSGASEVSRTTTNQVADGYSAFEMSLKGASPGRDLMSKYKDRASSLGAASPPPPTKPRTGFDSFKENLFSAADTVGSIAVPSEANASTLKPVGSPMITKKAQTPLDKLERSIPYKKSLAQELATSEELFSDNPVKRFQAEQEIREKEARERAVTRNERIRAKKDDVYKAVDKLQEAVDAFPEAIDKTEQAIKDAVKTFKGVPAKVEKTVDAVKAIPSSIQKTADQTKQSVAGTIDKTKKVVEDVIDIPNKMSRTIEDTQKAAVKTKESIKEGVSSVKVLLRLEQPKPKPPRFPPPKPRTSKDIALSVAGTVATGTGKVAWWATKGAAKVAWSGAKLAAEKTKSSSLPQLKIQLKMPVPPKNNLPTLTAAEKKLTEALQIEVNEALRLAEESLRKADE